MKKLLMIFVLIIHYLMNLSKYFQNNNKKKLFKIKKKDFNKYLI